MSSDHFERQGPGDPSTGQSDQTSAVDGVDPVVPDEFASETTGDPTGSVAVDQALLPRVPGVRLEAKIGRGGFATVYRGHQISVDRDVAVKIDDRRLVDARDRRRFSREIIAAGAVSGHPHIVTLYDGGTTDDDHPYLVMELYPGGSYAERMKASGPIAPQEVTEVGFAIADALVAAHDEGILHRDVKPGNILISRYGSPALTDFGLAALPPAGEQYSVTMDSLTPSYAAPEAFGGAEPTVGMDVYALGATLYAMLIGRPPRSDDTGASPPLTKLLLLLNDPLPPAPVPGAEELMPVIWRATAVDPEDRYRTAAEFRDDLAQVRAGHPERTHGLRPFASVPVDSETSGPQEVSTPLDPTRHGLAEDLDVAPEPSRRTGWLVAAAAVAAVAVTATALLFRPTAEGRPAMSSTPVAGGEITGAPVTDPTAPPTATDPVTTGPGTEGTAVPSTVDQLPSNVIETPPRAGDCFGAMTNVNGRWAGERVPCTEPHVWEAYAVGELDPTTPSSYINDVTVDPVVVQVCTDEELRLFLSGAGGTFTKLERGPSQDEFAAGQRQFWCLAKKAEAGEVTGSLRDG